MPNIVGLNSLRGGNDEGKEEDSDRPNQYYAGGAGQHGGGGSGLSVIGPDDGDQGGPNADQMANIVARARRDMEAVQAEGGSSNQPRHVITFYRDGFTVNDGPYRARSDPDNRPFLEAIERGVVPRELEGENPGEQVDISLVDKRQEDYVAPPQPSYTAFSGEGQTMGSTSYSDDVVVQSDSVSGASAPVVDDKQPTTTLQIRLHNGSRLRETLNLTHTLQDIHTLIHLREGGGQPYTLLAGFPPRPLSGDLSTTIEDAGLKGAAITQKLV